MTGLAGARRSWYDDEARMLRDLKADCAAVLIHLRATPECAEYRAAQERAVQLDEEADALAKARRLGTPHRIRNFARLMEDPELAARAEPLLGDSPGDVTFADLRPEDVPGGGA